MVGCGFAPVLVLLEATTLSNLAFKSVVDEDLSASRDCSLLQCILRSKTSTTLIRAVRQILAW